MAEPYAPKQQRPRQQKRRRKSTNERIALNNDPSSDFFCDASTWRTSAVDTVKEDSAVVLEPQVMRCLAFNEDDTIQFVEISMALPSLLRLRETGLLCRRRGSTNLLSLLRTLGTINRSDDDASNNGTSPFVSSRLGGIFPCLMLTMWNRQKRWMLQNGYRNPSTEHEETLFEQCDNVRPCWRPYAKRTILFSHLETSPCDAVLGITRDGSFLIAIGPAMCHETSIKLALRFYGVPSPHVLHSSATRHGRRSRKPTPMMYTIPLTMMSSSALFDTHEDASETRVDILVANNIGVAFILPLENEDNEMLGKLAIFSLPYSLVHTDILNNGLIACGVLHSSKVNINRTTSSLMKNLLWATHEIPHVLIDDDDRSVRKNSSDAESSSSSLATTEFDGYLLFNDEADGYRICWIQLEGSNSNEHKYSSTCSSNNNSNLSQLRYRAEAATIISIPVVDVEWQPITTHGTSQDDNLELPSWNGSSCGGDGGIRVALMAYLHIDVLLMDILSRCSSSFSPRQLSNFSYNIVSVEAGRIVELVIVFQNNKNNNLLGIGVNEDNPPRSLGLFILVDLISQSYEELDWVYSDLELRDEISLSNWSASLLSNRNHRGKGQQPKDTTNSSTMIKGQENIGLDSYFRESSCTNYCCDHYSNEAVVAMKPVCELRSTASPIEMHYG